MGLGWSDGSDRGDEGVRWSNGSDVGLYRRDWGDRGDVGFDGGDVGLDWRHVGLRTRIKVSNEFRGGNSRGEQYTTAVGVAGLVIVHGQSVMVRVVACLIGWSVTRKRVSWFEPAHLSHGVGCRAVDDLRRTGAIGDKGSHDLSGVNGNGAIVSVGSSSTSHEGSGGDVGTHLFLLWSIKII